jgi:DNA-binding NarL/FixJ family response regulator
MKAWNIAGGHPTPAAAERAGADGGLTPREMEILKLLARRCSNREIAEQLVLSIRTVERHINNLFAKTGLSDRRAALEYCQRHGLVPPPG